MNKYMNKSITLNVKKIFLLFLIVFLVFFLSSVIKKMTNISKNRQYELSYWILDEYINNLKKDNDIIYIYRDDKSKYTKKINVSQKEEKKFGKFVYDMANGNYLIINWHLLNGKNLKIDSYSLE